jgi:hypothetical protein
MCGRQILEALIASPLRGSGLFRALRAGLTYLLANARRANPNRDRQWGRLRAGLALVELAK